MPRIAQALSDLDLPSLRQLAVRWGMELEPVAEDEAALRARLAAWLADSEHLSVVVNGLPPAAQDALRELAADGGHIPWSTFTRRYGEVREMGPGRRERERPDLNPISTAELLWYRGLIGRAFLDLPPQPQEFAFVPDEWLPFYQSRAPAGVAPLGEPASAEEAAHPMPANDHILDLACTLLAGLRLGYSLEALAGQDSWEPPPPLLLSLLREAGLVDAGGQPVSDAVGAFLEAPRPQALLVLARAWLGSSAFNELRQLPGLTFEGDWENDPVQARRTLLGWLGALPTRTWWALSAFIAAVKEKAPDFQRPAGDYDSWFIRRTEDSTYLRGFSAWDEVDGALLRYLICGPLHWLGWVDLAAPGSGQPVAAFRPSAWAASLSAGRLPEGGFGTETSALRVQADGSIVIPPGTRRTLRYQVARYANWLGLDRNGYHYGLTVASLRQAQQQGLKLSFLITLLERHARPPLPPNVGHALGRFEREGAEVRIEPVTLLRFKSPQLLATLQKGPLRSFVVETLNAQTAVVRGGDLKALVRTLAEAGYLAETPQAGTVEPRADGTVAHRKTGRKPAAEASGKKQD